MTTQKFHQLLSAISLNILLCCADNKTAQFTSQTINSNEGVAIDTLSLIYNGPIGFTLEYFPRNAIQLAKIDGCEIMEQDSSSNRISKKVQFDNGNIIKEVNNFFSYWFEGTVRGEYKCEYDVVNRKLTMKGIPEEGSRDSVRTVWNYNTHGYLYSIDAYRFEKRLKPGADQHLPNPGDYEKYPTWNKEESDRFLVVLDTVIIETVIESKTVDKEKYQLLFDTSKRLRSVHKFRNGFLTKTTDYAYEPNGITGFIQRTMNDGTKWTYKSKAVLNNKGDQIEKIVFSDDGTEEVRMVIVYNDNGTIRCIKYGRKVQEFKYFYTGK